MGQKEAMSEEPPSDDALTLDQRRAALLEHQGAVYRLARALTPDEASAEDVLQETFLASFRHLDGWRAQGSMRAWLLTITRNKARRHMRRRSGQPEHFEPLGELGVEAGWGEQTPEALLIAMRRRVSLQVALDAMSPLDREVLILRDLEGLTGPEVAQILGVSLAAMKSRLHRARLRFVAQLRQGGFDG